MIFFRTTALAFLLTGLFAHQVVWAQESNTVMAWYRSAPSRIDAAPMHVLISQAEDALLEAIEIQDDSARVFLLLEAGMIYGRKAYDNEKAMDYYLRAMALADSTSFRTGQVITYMQIAGLFEGVGNTEKSLQFLVRASEFADRAGNVEVDALLSLALGRVCAAGGQHEEAAEHYQKVIALAKTVYMPDSEAEAHTQLAELAAAGQQYAEALELYKLSLGIWRKLGNRLQEAVTLNVIGDSYLSMNNQDRAYANYKAALDVYQSADSKQGVARASNSIGALYYQQKKYKEAIAQLELALSAGRSAQTKSEIRRSYEYLSLAYKALGDFRRALEYRELYLAMNDFIVKEESDQRLLDMQSRYALEEKEQQLEKLESVRRQRERELAEQERIQLYLYGMLALAGIILILIVYLYFLKQKSNRQLQAINARIEEQNIQLQNLNATKDKFFSIISHDLKGPLNSLTSFSDLLINHYDALSKEDIQDLAKNLDKSLKNLFVLLNNLLEWARSQTGNIDFTRDMLDIREVLQQNKELLEAQASQKSITLLYDHTGPLWVEANKPSINTVVRNLLSNAIKFTPAGGAIKLSATPADHEVVIAVSDTGVGMNKQAMNKLFRLDAKYSTPGTQQEQGTGLGLILCKDFVEKNNGRIWVESDEGKGSVFYFSLPAKKNA
jgi:signal transduction histidine kinase